MSHAVKTLEVDKSSGSLSTAEEKLLVLPAAKPSDGLTKSKKVLIEEIIPADKEKDRPTEPLSNDILLSKDDFILMIEILNYLLFTSPLFTNLVISFNRLNIPASLLLLYKELLLYLQIEFGKISNQEIPGEITFEAFEKYPLIKQLREILLKFLLNQSSMNIPSHASANDEDEVQRVGRDSTVFQYANSIQIVESFLMQPSANSSIPYIRLVVTEDSFFEVFVMNERERNKQASNSMWHKTLADLRSAEPNKTFFFQSDSLLDGIFQSNDEPSDSIAPSFKVDLLQLQTDSTTRNRKSDQLLLQKYQSNLRDLAFNLRVAVNVLSCFEESFWNKSAFLRKTPDLKLANNFVSSLFAYVLANYLYSDTTKNPFRKADNNQDNPASESTINLKAVNKVKFGVVLIGLQKYIPLESLLSNGKQRSHPSLHHPN